MVSRPALMFSTSSISSRMFGNTKPVRCSTSLVISSHALDPVTGKPLETSQLIKLNFFKVSFLALIAGAS